MSGTILFCHPPNYLAPPRRTKHLSGGNFLIKHLENRARRVLYWSCDLASLLIYVLQKSPQRGYKITGRGKTPVSCVRENQARKGRQRRSCRTFGTPSEARNIAGVSLRFTTCLWSVVPLGLSFCVSSNSR